MVQNLKKVFKSKISKKKFIPEARSAVCAKHVVKRPSKRSVLVYIYIYMFICTELIEETGRPPGLILACRNIFGPSSLGKKFTHLTEL